MASTSLPPTAPRLTRLLRPSFNKKGPLSGALSGSSVRSGQLLGDDQLPAQAEQGAFVLQFVRVGGDDQLHHVVDADLLLGGELLGDLPERGAFGNLDDLGAGGNGRRSGIGRRDRAGRASVRRDR